MKREIYTQMSDTIVRLQAVATYRPSIIRIVYNINKQKIIALSKILTRFAMLLQISSIKPFLNVTKTWISIR